MCRGHGFEGCLWVSVAKTNNRRHLLQRINVWVLVLTPIDTYCTNHWDDFVVSFAQSCRSALDIPQHNNNARKNGLDRGRVEGGGENGGGRDGERGEGRKKGERGGGWMREVERRER